MKLGGSMIIHNAVEFDYCVEIALRSLLPVCDEVAIVDAESDDGTRSILMELVQEFPKLRVLAAPWKPNPGGWGGWLSDLSNVSRLALKGSGCTHHIGLQADEVLEAVDPAWFRHYIQAHPCALHRLNFWIDHRHLVPSGRVCNDKVIRCGPIDSTYVGDAESILAEKPVLLDRPHIFHYGFIRRTEEYVAKAKPMHLAFTGTNYDPALDTMLEDKRKGFEQHIPLSACRVFNGDHPNLAKPWLRERGYDV